jgi:hypothetical protein
LRRDPLLPATIQCIGSDGQRTDLLVLKRVEPPNGMPDEFALTAYLSDERYIYSFTHAPSGLRIGDSSGYYATAEANGLRVLAAHTAEKLAQVLANLAPQRHAGNAWPARTVPTATTPPELGQ